ncbi:MAG: phospho-N-acetylmuramoyl-pentapeptide-transferase [Clostridia bacterium]|nr:phospho-N-acetylmuramoyl-pentapeptide-transferase [Clostridia bacterium]
MLIEFLVVIACSFGLTVLLSHFVIPILKSKKMGQKILEIGPRWHKSKEGTPTMGGICFIAAILLCVGVALIVDASEIKRILLVMILALSNGLIGLIDDRAKLMKKQNEGLLAWQKYLLQLLAAGLFLVLQNVFGLAKTALALPYTDLELELGIGYYVIALLLITGVVNSVNLTDGIDGLASTVSLVVAGFFAVAAFAFGARELGLLSAALIGGLIGFLVYNFHPARVFMGDTGSLFLGGFLTGLAFALGEPLIILICGLMFVVEAASVILQVSVFKLSGRKKRLFKMAPIHHHFEQCGWNEYKIVAVFGAVTLACCVLAWFGI